MSNQLQATMKKDMDERQREFFLRPAAAGHPQGARGRRRQGRTRASQRERVAEKKLSVQARATVDKELAWLERIPPSSPEYTVARNYIDWILDLPWLDSTTDTLDLVQAERDLDQDHYGPARIKKMDPRVPGGAQAQGGHPRAHPLPWSARPAWARPRSARVSPAP